MKYTIIVDEHEAISEGYKAGDKVLVLQKEDLNDGSEWYAVSKAFAETGYPGNLDHTEFRFHGWRGTTNNISTYAMGVYEIKKIEELDDWGDEIKVTIGRKDWKKGEE